MARALILFVGGLLLLVSCTQRTICPAFQSAYIYDKDELRKKFSYFQEDSTPKILTASKNRYLVAEPTPYRKKLRSLQTVEMKPVPVQVPDSLTNGQDSVSLEELDRAARSVIDSTFIPDLPPAPEETATASDSVYVITKDREMRLLKYNMPDSLVFDSLSGRYVAQKPAYWVKHVGLNIEQDSYMWYLRDYLVLPDVRLARIQQNAERSRDAAVKKKKERKGLKGFFKNLFKKKPAEPDSTLTPPPPQEEFDFIDVDTLTQVNPPPPENDAEERRGFFAPRQRRASEEPAGQNNKDKPQPQTPIRDEEAPEGQGF